MKKFWKIMLVIVVICVLGIGYILYNAFSIYRYSKIDETQKASVAIVLGASSYNGQPSVVYSSRIKHAVNLYKKGFVKKIIFTGGYGMGTSVSDSQAAKKYANNRGVPNRDILIEENSHSTQGNLQYAYKIMKDNGFDSANIVSDPLHMKRAMLTAEDVGITAFSSPIFNSSYKTRGAKIKFLMRETFCYSGYSIYRFFIRGRMREKLSTEKIVYLKNKILSKTKMIFEKWNAILESIILNSAKVVSIPIDVYPDL